MYNDQQFFSGFYLFLQVQFPLSLASIKFKHFQVFGWGKFLPYIWNC